jgi:hypothetical protein
MSLPVTTGWLALSEITSSVALAGTTTSATGFESEPSGFCTWTLKLPAAATSGGSMVMLHSNALAQFVALAAPLNSTVEPGPGLLGTKFKPSSFSVKPSAAPTSKLAGARASTVTALEIATVAAADWEGSSWIVATIEIALVEGAAAGAVYTPLELMLPHVAADQDTCQLTLWFDVPRTSAVNSAVPNGARNASAGQTFIWTCERIVTWVLAPREGSAALVAVIVTGLLVGRLAGARKSTLPTVAPVGETQGFEPATQICPRFTFPFSTPSTDQVTAWLGVFTMVAENVCRWLTASVAEVVDKLTDTSLTTLIVAPVDWDGSAWLVAWSSTGLLGGKLDGAI